MYQQKNPSLVKGNDKILLLLYTIIVLIGLVCIYSVEYKSTDDFTATLLGFKKNYSKQFFFFGFCLVIGIV